MIIFGRERESAGNRSNERIIIRHVPVPDSGFNCLGLASMHFTPFPARPACVDVTSCTMGGHNISKDQPWKRSA